MYIINREKNRVNELDERSFYELGFKERNNLQEWIANAPSIFGEELLIIQKEFDGFNDTNERLDLLALDKRGNLVIIENKLDDTGRDVTWQALKYTSYCSSLTKENIRKIFQDYLDSASSNLKADEVISEFYDGQDYSEISLNKGLTQRIILVAAKFRKEVTSTVLWLLNYKIQIQCYLAKLYSLDEQLFLNLEQIIPTKDAEEFMIGMADKVQDDLETQTELKNRHIVRKEFWFKILEVINKKCNLFQNVSASIYSYIPAGSGVRGVQYTFTASKSYGRTELYIDRGDKEENEFVFDELFKEKDKIEKEFGNILIWERLNDKRACRIKVEIEGDIFNKERWEGMIEFMTENMAKLEKTLKEPLSKINTKLKHMT